MSASGPRTTYHADAAEEGAADPPAPETDAVFSRSRVAPGPEPAAGRASDAGDFDHGVVAAPAGKDERFRAVARALARHVAFGGPAAPPASEGRVPTGFAALDRATGGGLVRGALNEVFTGAPGDGAAEALLPALARAGGRRLFAWIHPTRAPYPPALAQAGFDLARWILVRPRDGDDHLFALELALRSGACEAVVAHAGDLADRALRRLQTAAEEGCAVALLLRPAALAPRPSPAAVRLLAEPAASPDLRRRRLVLRVLKARGATHPSSVLLDWSRDPSAPPPDARAPAPAAPDAAAWKSA